MKSASEIYSPNAGQQFASRALSVIANVGADDELERLAHPRAVGDRMKGLAL